MQGHFRASPPKSPPKLTGHLPQSLPQSFWLLPQLFWRARKTALLCGFSYMEHLTGIVYGCFCIHETAYLCGFLHFDGFKKTCFFEKSMPQSRPQNQPFSHINRSQKKPPGFLRAGSLKLLDFIITAPKLDFNIAPVIDRHGRVAYSS